MKTRALIRTVVIVLLTVVAMAVTGADILLPWHPFSTYGFSATSSGAITAVDDTGVRAGLHVGDQINVMALAPSDRIRVASFSIAPEGSTLRLPLASGRVVTLGAHPRLRSLADNLTDLIYVISIFAFLVIAATLVLLRPSPSTWAFYAFGYCFFTQGALVWEWMPLDLATALLMLGGIAFVASPFGFFAFALHFPNERAGRLMQKIERILIAGVLPVLALTSLVLNYLGVFHAFAAPSWLEELELLIAIALYGAGVAVLFVRYAQADREVRIRLQWIVAAFAVAFLPGLLTIWFNNVSGIPAPLWWLNTAYAWEVLAPIALAYTILRHRLFDIRFVVSRALVFGVMTSAVVGVLALVDWALGRWLAQSRFALVAELGLALLLGVFLTTVHRRIEAALNNVIFRTQMLAMRALRRFALEVDLIADPKRLVSQTYEALRSRVECDFVAIYTGDGASFALATPASKDTTPRLLPNDDFAVLRLRRWSEPFVCDEPGHALRGALLLPMSAHTQLVGFIVCGPKCDRTLYLPDEIDTLEGLAHRTGAAYAWLTFRAPSAEAFDPLKALREPS
jgi:hypothetical protein